MQSLIEIGVDLINVSIVFYHILHELTKVSPEGSNSGVSIKSCQPHHGFVHERGHNFGSSIHHHLIIPFIGMSESP